MLAFPTRRPTARADFAGLSVLVYRPADGIDATNQGPSSRYDTMTLYPESGAPRDDDDVLVLVEHRFGLRAIPYAYWRDHRHVMFGGNFCFTSDSRLPSQASAKLPIKIFDRVEEDRP